MYSSLIKEIHYKTNMYHMYIYIYIYICFSLVSLMVDEALILVFYFIFSMLIIHLGRVSVCFNGA